jgi:hypothetical protein
MKKLSVTVIAAAITLAFSAGALAAQAISNDEYKARKDRIAVEYKSGKAACKSLSANAKDVCIAEAKGKEKVAMAELEAARKPSDKTRHAVAIAKAEAAYEVAREKCDDTAGADKTACLMKAKAAETRDKADAKAQKKTS